MRSLRGEATDKIGRTPSPSVRQVPAESSKIISLKSA